MTSPIGTPDDIATTELHAAAENLVLAKQRSLLMVEDTAAHALILKRAFDPSLWNVEHVTRIDDALSSFTRNAHRMVLLDLSLPDGSGLDLLTRLRNINAAASIIVVTSVDQVQISVQAMQKGACNYVVKQEPDQTTQNIQSAVEQAWLQRVRKAEKELVEKSKVFELIRSQRLDTIEHIVRTLCTEVSSPLSGVVALSQLLSQKKDLDVDLQRLADGIHASAQEVADVVHKLNNANESINSNKTK